MNRLALIKAQSRIRIMQKTVVSLETCKDYGTPTEIWFIFLTATKSVYTVLEQGAKASPQSSQWFDAKAQERRKDPLIQYMYQARNDDEHGLRFGTEHVSGQLSIGVAKPGFSTAMRFNTGPDGTLHVTSLDDRPVLVEHAPPHARLIRVHGRRGEPYDLPENHKGITLTDRSPHAVASLMTTHLESVVSEAELLV